MGNSYTSLFFHIVWSTRGKIPYFSERGQKILYTYIGTLAYKQDVELIAIGGIADHIHILVKINSINSVSGFVRNIKASSSRFIRKSNENCFDFEWQVGYGVFTVSASVVGRIRRYILNQKEHHEIVGFEKELELLTQF